MDPQEAKSAIEIIQLALQLDDKGEFWKFNEIFGSKTHEKDI